METEKILRSDAKNTNWLIGIYYLLTACVISVLHYSGKQDVSALQFFIVSKQLNPCLEVILSIQP